MLRTSPLPTGSATVSMTMGMLRVACTAASAAGVPGVTMTSTESAASSAPSAGSGSVWTPA